MYDSKGTVLKKIKDVPNFLRSNKMKKWMVVKHDKSQNFPAIPLFLFRMNVRIESGIRVRSFDSVFRPSRRMTNL